MKPFVLLYHRCPDASSRVSHYDFMLAVQDPQEKVTLWTWALQALPYTWTERINRPELNSTGPQNATPQNGVSRDRVSALRLANHRAAYLTYQGPLSENRGSVTQLVAGNYTFKNKISWDPLNQARPLAFSVYLKSNLLSGWLKISSTGPLPGDWVFDWREA